MSYKQKYKSIYGAKGLITAPNYLAEQILFKRATAKHITIPNRIWDTKYRKDLQFGYWHGAYFGEMKKANTVLKEYDEDCAVKAIDDNECKLILSLYNKKFKRVAGELQYKKERAEKVKEHNPINIVTTTTLPSKQAGKKNKLGKLK